jgi:NADPH:quinone reductase
MKAIRVHAFGGPEVLSYEEVPDPVARPTELTIRARAIGVNPVDTYIRSGAYGDRAFPFTPGNDAAGTVEVVGPEVTGFAPGDRVYTARTSSGAYAERIVAPASGVYRLPDKTSFAEGACLAVPCATAYAALFLRGLGKPGDTVLVHGASGGVGTAATALARAAGLTVIATAGSEAGQRLVVERGAHFVVDHRADDEVERILALTDGRGVDLVVEMLANKNLGKDLLLLAEGGRVVVVGSRGRVEIDARDAMRREASIRGMSLMNATDEELRRIHAALGAALESGVLAPVVGKELPLAEAARAHRDVLAGPAFGNIVLTP